MDPWALRDSGAANSPNTSFPFVFAHARIAVSRKGAEKEIRRKETAMIRLVLIASTLSLITSVPVAAQTNSSKPPLELTVAVVSQSYCAMTSDASSLEMRLKLRYRNVGTQKLILYKGHDLFYQTKIRSMPGNPSGPYEVWVLNSRYFDEEFEPIDRTSPSNVFRTMSPGAVFEREIMIGVGVVNGKAARGDSSISAGEHTLHLVVSTWYQSRAMAQKLRQEWQRKGLLWADPVASAPVHFVAVRPQLIAPCRSSN